MYSSYCSSVYSLYIWSFVPLIAATDITVNMKLQSFILLLVLSTASFLSSVVSEEKVDVTYIKPTSSTGNLCPSEPCLTLSQFAENTKQESQSVLSLYILPGNHVLDREISVTNISKISIVANSTCVNICLLYTSPSPRDATLSRMPSSA